MFKLMSKEINAILGAQTILIWTYDNDTVISRKLQICRKSGNCEFQVLFKVYGQLSMAFQDSPSI